MNFCWFPGLRASFRFMFQLRQDALNNPWMSKCFHYCLAANAFGPKELATLHLSCVCVCVTCLTMSDAAGWYIYLQTFGSFVQKKIGTYYIFHTWTQNNNNWFCFRLSTLSIWTFLPVFQVSVNHSWCSSSCLPPTRGRFPIATKSFSNWTSLETWRVCGKSRGRNIRMSWR